MAVDDELLRVGRIQSGQGCAARFLGGAGEGEVRHRVGQLGAEPVGMAGQPERVQEGGRVIIPGAVQRQREPVRGGGEGLGERRRAAYPAAAGEVDHDIVLVRGDALDASDGLPGEGAPEAAEDGGPGAGQRRRVRPGEVGTDPVERSGGGALGGIGGSYAARG